MSKQQLQFDDHTVSFEVSGAAKERVWNICLKWFRENELWSGECICQCDKGLIESPQLAAELADEGFKFETEYTEE